MNIKWILSPAEGAWMPDSPVSICGPTSSDPASCIASSQCVLIRLPSAVYSVPLSAPALHRLPLTYRMQLQGLKPENRLLCHLPPSAFPARSRTPWVSQPCWLCGGPFSHLSVCRYCSLCPRARGQCARTEKAGESQAASFPPVPPGGACVLLSSNSPQGLALDLLGVPHPC